LATYFKPCERKKKKKKGKGERKKGHVAKTFARNLESRIFLFQKGKRREGRKKRAGLLRGGDFGTRKRGKGKRKRGKRHQPTLPNQQCQLLQGERRGGWREKGERNRKISTLPTLNLEKKGEGRQKGKSRARPR